MDVPLRGLLLLLLSFSILFHSHSTLRKSAAVLDKQRVYGTKREMEKVHKSESTFYHEFIFY